MIRRIKYWEPDRYGNDVMVTMSAELAIRFQKECAASVREDFEYQDDEEALIDYMVVHWAWFDGGE